MKHSRIPIIDTIKGISIIMILLTHHLLDSQLRHRLLFPYWIDMAVPLFMLVSGYVSAKSYEKKQLNLEQAYSPKNYVTRLRRLLRPYIIFFVIECICLVFKHALPPIIELVMLFFRGGMGSGNYYVAIMVMLVFVYPLIYFAIKAQPKRGLIAFFILNIAVEFLGRVYLLDTYTYRYNLLRYLTLLAFGTFLAMWQQKISPTVLACIGGFGAVFIYMVAYRDYVPHIVNADWAGTTYLASCWVIPIFYLLIKKCNGLNIPVIGTLGKASYHIYLAQMFHFAFVEDWMIITVDSQLIQLLIVVVGVSAVGFVFYYLDTLLSHLGDRLWQL